MSNLVVVAIPAEDDPVWKVSTEKAPHMTILFLGENGDNPNKSIMAQFLVHAANLGLTRFGLDVDRRGELGEDKADVIFFDDWWELPRLRQFRHHLLQENNIRKAYESAPQREGGWIPHLTLGYPARPAKDNAVDYPIRYVMFDKIALWDGDSEGMEIVLNRDRYDLAMPGEAGWAATAKTGAEFLSHFGVKGMRWGVRKERGVEAVSRPDQGVLRRKTTISTTGGHSQEAHTDAIKTAEHLQKFKKSGAAALSNQDLRDVTTRLQLEEQVSVLTSKKGKRFVRRQIAEGARSEAQTRIRKGTSDAIKLVV